MYSSHQRRYRATFSCLVSDYARTFCLSSVFWSLVLLGILVSSTVAGSGLDFEETTTWNAIENATIIPLSDSKPEPINSNSLHSNVTDIETDHEDIVDIDPSEENIDESSLLLVKNDTEADVYDDDGDEEEDQIEPKKAKLFKSSTHNSKEDEDDANETSDGNLLSLHALQPKTVESNHDDDDDDVENEDEEDDDYDESSVEEFAENVCTAGYFIDKMVPEDYPTEISKDVKHINETIERLNRMYNFSTQMFEKLSPFFREMVSRISDFLYESQLDPQCMGALFRVLTGMKQRKPWALNFLDASGPMLTGGLQEGMFVSFGEFDQCLDIASDEDTNHEPIYGQYCLLKPVIPVPEDSHIKKGEKIVKINIGQVNRFFNDEYIETYLGLYKFYKRTLLRIGICLPHKCDPASVESAMNRLLVRKTGLSVQVGPHCVKAIDSASLDAYQIVTIAIFTLVWFLIAFGTLYEIIYRTYFEARMLTSPSSSIQSSVTEPSRCSSPKPHYQRQMSKPYVEKPLAVQLLTTFSIIRNTRVLFQLPTKHRYLQLDTIRLLLTLFFFVANTYCYTLLFSPMIVKRFYVLGPMQFVSEKKYFFIRMYYMIGVFFTLSGIGVALSFRRKHFNYIRYVIQNYLRYSLPIMVTVGLIYLVPQMSSGPLWHLFDETMSQQCKNNLWSTLFFYNNLQTNIEDICNFPTVFVSAIFQLKVIAPIFLIGASYFEAKTGTMFLFLVFAIVTAFGVVPRYYFQLKVPYEYRSMKSFAEIKESIMFYSFNPFYHLSLFIFGLAIGHYIRTCKPNKRKQRRSILVSGLVALFISIFSFVFMESIDLMNPSLSMVDIIGMVTFGKVSLSCLFCWIIYACVTGHITIINRFLSSIAFRPLAQLSYSFYIVSAVVTCYRMFSIRQNMTMSCQTMFRAIVSDAVLSFLLAYLIHIMIQQPIKNLSKILIHWKQLFPIDLKSKSFSFKRRSFQPAVYVDHGLPSKEKVSEKDPNNETMVQEDQFDHSHLKHRAIMLELSDKVNNNNDPNNNI